MIKEDKKIIQNIIDRDEYQKYLYEHDSAIQEKSRSIFTDIKEWFLDALANNLSLDPKEGTDFLSFFNDLAHFPYKTILWILVTFLLIFMGIRLYPYLKRLRNNSKNTINPKERVNHSNEIESLNVTDAWKDLINSILNQYLSYMHLSLQPSMTLRQFLNLLRDHKKEDIFIVEFVEFLEKWRFSDWHPDQKTIDNWFEIITKKVKDAHYSNA